MIIATRATALRIPIFRLYCDKPYSRALRPVNLNLVQLLGIRRVSWRSSGNGLRWLSKRHVIAVLLAIALVLAATACGPDAPRDEAATQDVRGLVLRVEASSLLELKSLVVEDDDGVEWAFEGRGGSFTGFTPSHLREHMVLDMRVTVTFHREDGALVLDEVGD